ncbi:MAG: helix-turn-helix transcriptional regulator [Thiohalocapsa sp.]
MPDDVEIFISKKRAHEITGVSPREQGRKPGFPRAIKIGQGPNGRQVLVLREVKAWQAEQIARRDRELGLDAPPPPVAPAPQVPSDQQLAPPVKRGRGRPPGSKDKRPRVYRPGVRPGRPPKVRSDAPAEPQPLAAAE